MNGGRVARRYARAVFDLAVARHDLAEWLRDVRLIQAFLDEPNVAALLESPAVPFERKLELVKQGLSGLPESRLNLVYLLVEHGRVRAIDSIAAELQHLAEEHQGIAVADVTTAVPLDDATSRGVVERLERLTGKKVILKQRVDPSILGGVVARIGDHLIDGSVAGQLAALRAELATGQATDTGRDGRIE